MRLFAVSDLHVDFSPNARIVEVLSRYDYVDDSLIVAGDIAHQEDRVRWALARLRERFAGIFYVPGNHELWVRRGHGTSLDRYAAMLEICRDLGVSTGPGWAGSIWVVPLLSWYDASLGRPDDPAELGRWADHRYCRWPSALASPAEHFGRLNRVHLGPPPGCHESEAASRITGPDSTYAHVVSFSHFLPRADLLPPTSVLRFRALPAVAGSTLIERQLRKLGSSTHIFGHSHIQRDVVLDGVRYVQNALGYPRERRERPFELRMVWQS